MIAIKSVLVATDFSPASDAAFAYARDLARTFNATLYILHVADDLSRYAFPDGTALLAPAELQAEIEQTAQAHLRVFMGERDLQDVHAVPVLKVSNSAGKMIVECAKESAIDLVVVGTHGRGTIDRLLMGSVAEHVIRHAPCPVLAVRVPEPSPGRTATSTTHASA